jgi:hypothetical protein
VTDQSPLAPFILDEAEAAQTSHCLMLFDGDMEEVEDVFEEPIAEGNGLGWEGLAQSLVHSFMPELADRLDFGSESGTFVVTSTDLTVTAGPPEPGPTSNNNPPLRPKPARRSRGTRRPPDATAGPPACPRPTQQAETAHQMNQQAVTKYRG